jgi:hypothetical protein
MKLTYYLLSPGTMVDYIEQHSFARTLTYPLWNDPCHVEEVDILLFTIIIVR